MKRSLSDANRVISAPRPMRAQLDQLLRKVEARGVRSATRVCHVTAFSGGVDSSLVAALVHRVFPTTSAACLGVSAAVPAAQIEQARDVASFIGVPLWEFPTKEGEMKEYVENVGKSCYYCKTTLYSTINQVADHAVHVLQPTTDQKDQLVLFNGTNADDKLDPTRLGLVAATEFDVASPLDELTKTDVRQMAKYLGLPNWNAAASPCLRSRLQFGVEATQEHLGRVERAEAFVRSIIDLPKSSNMRVRYLAGNRAAVGMWSLAVPGDHHHSLTSRAELDADMLPAAQKVEDAVREELLSIGKCTGWLRSNIKSLTMILQVSAPLFCDLSNPEV
ncbi:TPA: hypothetical protein N0F65_007328 [Lagenidium giganteum]|uniref:NAD/GMP synthase domain-containing protein n=1 Tax=Lagenidium giganteum TaxID=4803 RepID=A0AAV2Z4V6_9STRA|nr:TPA: hypothetical protein N0F65_007328 [Lagenidium giganteum]